MSNSEILLSLISITLLILLLVSAIVMVTFLSGKKSLKLQMEMAQNKLNYEQELRKAETEVSEATMKQVGRELHDNICQLLTVIHLQIENKSVDHPELQDEFITMGDHLANITQQVRSLSHTLNDEYLARIGLLPAINIEANRIRSLHKFDVHWQAVSGISNLDKNQELMTFRVLQEIIQNSLRYSSAHNFYISVKNENGSFELKAGDDGKGFDLEDMMQSDKASGLQNIIKRAKYSGLNCIIEATSGKGCYFTLRKISGMELTINN